MDQYPVPHGQPQGDGQPFEYQQPLMTGPPDGPAQPSIITTQSNVSYVSPGTVVVTSGKRPPNITVLAWLACLCCFWPTGICAIMYASQANNEVDNGEAWRKYRMSRTLSIISIIVGTIWVAIAIWNYTTRYYSN